MRQRTTYSSLFFGSQWMSVARRSTAFRNISWTVFTACEVSRSSPPPLPSTVVPSFFRRTIRGAGPVLVRLPDAPAGKARSNCLSSPSRTASFRPVRRANVAERILSVGLDFVSRSATYPSVNAGTRRAKSTSGPSPACQVATKRSTPTAAKIRFQGSAWPNTFRASRSTHMQIAAHSEANATHSPPVQRRCSPNDGGTITPHPPLGIARQAGHGARAGIRHLREAPRGIPRCRTPSFSLSQRENPSVAPFWLPFASADAAVG